MFNIGRKNPKGKIVESYNIENMEKWSATYDEKTGDARTVELRFTSGEKLNLDGPEAKELVFLLAQPASHHAILNIPEKKADK